jgi:antitoxin YefM
MEVVNYTEFRKNLTKSLNKVNDDAEIVVVSRSKGKNVVVMALEEYNAIQETLHVVKSVSNRNRLDNRLVNLRVTTRSTNLHNSPSRGESGIKGVSMISPSRRKKSKKLWQARIQVNNEEHDLGSFYTMEEAAAARKFAEWLLIPV